MKALVSRIALFLWFILSAYSPLESQDCPQKLAAFVGSGAEQTRQVIIIGGGPAGMALAKSLQDIGVDDFIVLERGESPGNSWAKMHDSLCLQGCGFEIGLPGSDQVTGPGALSRWGVVTGKDFHRHLVSYAKHFRLPIQTQVVPYDVIQGEQEFLVHLSDGRVLRSTILVNSTGYYSKPRMPEGFVGGIHAADYRNPDQVWELAAPRGWVNGADSPKILIVGDRVSAGQILVDLVDSARPFDLSISMKLNPRTMQYDRDPRRRGLFYVEMILTELLMRTGLARVLPPFIEGRMEAGRAREILTRESTAKILPAALSGEGGVVQFVDGSSRKFDLVIYATGYRPALDHLKNLITIERRSGEPKLKGMMSAEVPGLYFLGIRGQRTVLSQYLRGIRSDARVLAMQIANQLKGEK